jgi:hypothetical protein
VDNFVERVDFCWMNLHQGLSVETDTSIMTEEQPKNMREKFDAHFSINEKMMATSKHFDTSLFLQLLKQVKFK